MLLIKIYNTDNKVGFYVDKDAIWIEILGTLPDNKKKKLEGFWTIYIINSNTDLELLLVQINYLFNVYYLRNTILIRLYTIRQYNS
jgi:hypothetical protein